MSDTMLCTDELWSIAYTAIDEVCDATGEEIPERQRHRLAERAAQIRHRRETGRVDAAAHRDAVAFVTDGLVDDGLVDDGPAVPSARDVDRAIERRVTELLADHVDLPSAEMIAEQFVHDARHNY